MRTLQRLLQAIALCIILASCNRNEVRIAILHTNDNHGKIDNMAKISALKAGLLEKYDTVLLISGGDMFSGDPYIDFYEPKGYPMLDIMNKVGYDLAVLGNHEFDYGQEVLDDRMEQANFPVLCANIKSTGAKLPDNIVASHTISVKGINIEFTGVIETENNGIPSTHPKKVEGYSFTPPIEAINHYTPSENTDFTILLNHVGFNTDSIIAVNHPEFKVIIGGHSHTLIDETKLINDVMVAQAGHYLKHLGMISLTFKNGKLKERVSQPINMKNVPVKDEKIAETINKYLTNPELDKTLAITKSTLGTLSEMGCLMTDAQKELHDVDFVFQNSRGIRIDSIPSGPINKNTIFRMDPFNNELMVYSLSVKDIKSLIDYSYNLTKGIDLFISGGSYKLVVDNNKELKDIILFDNNKSELDSTRTYKVGLNSYIGNSYKFSHNGETENTNTTTANNVIEYLSRKKEIDYSGSKRVTIEMVN